MLPRFNLRFFIVAIIAVSLLSASFHGLGLIKGVSWRWVYSDTLGFYDRVVAPGFPYIDKQIEYPVLTGLFMQLAGWLGQSRAGYFALTSFFLILIAALATYFLYKIKTSWTSDVQNIDTNFGTSDVSKNRLWQFWIFAPSMLIFSVYNWDLIALLFVILAFYFTGKNKDDWAAFFLALGFSAKFYPIIYLIPLLLKNHSNILKNVGMIGIFIVTAAAINLPFAFLNFDGWSYFFTLNSSRSPNLDSIWTVVRWLFPSLDDIPKINFLSLVLFALSYFWLILKNRKENFINLCFIATLLFLIFNKVFTPQYVLWLLPFLTILPLNRITSWFYTLEFSNLIILFLTLSWFFAGKDIAYFYRNIPFILLRHAALIFILLAVLKLKTASPALLKYK